MNNFEHLYNLSPFPSHETTQFPSFAILTSHYDYLLRGGVVTERGMALPIASIGLLFSLADCGFKI
jgi:hypothetical protein